MDFVDFSSPQDNQDANIKDFLEEQILIVGGLMEKVAANPDPKNEEFGELMSYVKGAAEAAHDSIREAWPELRDTGALTREMFEKVTMTGALCGVIASKAVNMLGSLPDGPAVTMLINMILVSDNSKAMRSQAVTMRVTADTLLNRAIKEEQEQLEDEQ